MTSYIVLLSVVSFPKMADISFTTVKPFVWPEINNRSENQKRSEIKNYSRCQNVQRI